MLAISPHISPYLPISPIPPALALVLAPALALAPAPALTLTVAGAHCTWPHLPRRSGGPRYSPPHPLVISPPHPRHTEPERRQQPHLAEIHP